MNSKKRSDSFTVMSELVSPNHTNTLGNLMGGNLLYMMDMCAGIVSQRHANRTCVTASVDHVEFVSPVKLGEVVHLEGHINRAFRTSMEIEIEVWAENPQARTRTSTNRAFYTMVALDEDLRPTPIPAIEPANDAERAQYDAAERRRQLRLILAGRAAATDLPELLQDILSNIPQNENA